MVDGCFWHGCPDHFTVARTNAEYWASKVKTNRTRDLETTRIWIEAGWVVLRFWEHEPVDVVAHAVETQIREGWRVEPSRVG